jgi:hypothetical protein
LTFIVRRVYELCIDHYTRSTSLYWVKFLAGILRWNTEFGEQLRQGIERAIENRQQPINCIIHVGPTGDFPRRFSH